MNTLQTKTKTPDQTKACPPERRGSGLIFAVVLLFVILGMVITLSSITMLETKMNQKTKSSVGAFYGSESGVEWALNQIATKSGPLSSITGFSGSFAPCPAGVGTCKVYFLDSNGKVLASTATIDQVKAVRSVGTQGGDTQRAIEAAVAGTGTGKYQTTCTTIGMDNASVVCFRTDTELGTTVYKGANLGGGGSFSSTAATNLPW